MTKPAITKAFILGAGLGTRMRPLTNDIPKPMVPLRGRSLIMHALDRLNDHGITDVTINTHYKADKLHAHLKDWTAPRIHWSDEETLLDTGGGLKKAVGHFNGDDFFVTAGDSYWHDGPGKTAIRNLEHHWDPARMDILILLQPIETMTLTRGIGDYSFENEQVVCGPVKRALKKDGTHMFTSLRINTSAIFEGAPDSPFSYLDLMDRAEKQGRLYGLVHDGDWHHISTPDDLHRVDQHLKTNG